MTITRLQPHRMDFVGFLENLSIFLSSLPDDFEHGNEKHIAQLPHNDSVKAHYRFWLEKVHPTCLRVIALKRGTPVYVCMQKSKRSTIRPIVCYYTSDFVNFTTPHYFDDEVAANEYLDKLLELTNQLKKD